METYQRHNNPVESNEQKQARIYSMSKTSIWARIYLWFGLGIVLSGIVGFAYPWLLGMLVSSVEDFVNIYLGSIIGSAVVLFPLMLIFQIGAMKNKSVLTGVCYVIYAIAFGILLSSSLYYAGAETSLYALLITGGIMAILGVASIFLKDKLNSIAMIAMTFGLGALILSLVNFFFFNNIVYWIASFAMLIAIILIVVFDFGSISRSIEENREMGNAMIIYNAFRLYSDFLYIFIRILAILAASKKD